MKFLSQDGLAYLWTKIQAKLDALASRITTDETAIAGKVDKVEGKGLSTEDYTTAEKAKLAGVEAGANAYTLPAATSGALGGVKQGANVSIAADGTLSATDTTYGEATTGSAGLMSAADKTKLDGVETGANAYSLPKAAADTLGGIMVGNNLSIDPSTGVLSATATSYTLPIADSGTLGGVKINGGNLSIDSSTGVLSATYSAATQSAAGLMSADDKTKLDGIPSLSAGRYIELYSTGGASNPGLQIRSTAPQILQGTNVSLTEDSENCTVTISATYGEATTGSAGLMSATDKAKLDGISTAALTYSSGNGWSGFGGVLSEIYFGNSGLATITINAQRSASNISGYIALNSSGTPLPKKPTSEVKVPIVSEEGKSLYVKIASGGTSVMIGRDDSDNWGAGVQTIHATIAFSAS